MITPQEIAAHEAENKRIRKALAQIGREIHAIRYAEEMPSGFRLQSYSMTTFEGSHYCGMEEGIEWEKGEPIVALEYYYSSWQDHRNITFPQSWLTQDWKKLETDRVTAIREAARARAEVDREIAKAAREAADRRTYERLKAKFEGEAAQT